MDGPIAPPLPVGFYARPAREVALALLGAVLVHSDGRSVRSGRIVETEAYVGPEDLACHASKGVTKRTEVLFGPPGRAYVYLIYGMYRLFNAVVDEPGVGAAVLVRAVAPLEGLDPGARTDGPGRLSRALGIELHHNRTPLQGPTLTIHEGTPVARRQIARGPRIGVDYAGAWAKKPLRFWLRDDPHVSRVYPRSPKGAAR